jgi:hypothetical protein
MNYLEESVVRFKSYADTVLKSETDELARMDESHLISGKLARFTIFNAHLNILKKKLDNETKQIITDAERNNAGEIASLEKQLADLQSEYINEYLCISFVKDQ